ncbi:hypothetical protein NG800_003110 [Epilithonimonas ginsengisoli]|uniref:Lipoprotein n=1 Tax=Epilithonimonas ginsengisoli TaxID=1245592 RepID=A0ABU4JDZ7_9FLAO|nr:MULTISPECIES: hypothetical protein [Chryseobacterium group]MBV6879039.1 hypothetical protein [Epilithonimonas sp. FP105]MDW8547886.1 hypothetical protein [Epilithonimonas ginsengisoli]OAH74947.1 hypothetical protein AXA65_05640 [Chryseobacterium sp. FP211-J200]
MNKNYLFALASLLFLSCEQKPETNHNSLTSDSNSKNSNLDYENVIPKETEEEKKIREEEQEALRKEKETEELYGNKSLQTGSTPYSSNYGENSNCDDYGCSQINVTTSNSDVMVTIKKNDQVVRHAYIRAGDNYSFSFPNGTYQTFFYYGKGWNPKKVMKGGELEGGFIKDEHVGKDEPKALFDNILEYELILQPNGNFSTQPSNLEEAL